MNEKTYSLRRLFPILFLFIGMAGVVAPYLSQRGFPGDLGDARYNMYVLEHAFLVFSGKLSSFLNIPVFFPWTNIVCLSDTHWGTAPIYALFRWGGGTPESAFGNWFLVGFVLNYLSAYFVNRRFGLEALGASIGAFLFAFSLPVIAQDGHAQLLYRCFIPLSLWVFHRYLKTKDPFFIGVTAVLVAFQFLATFYMGVFLVFLLASYGIVIYFDNIKPQNSFWDQTHYLFFPNPIRGRRLFLTIVLMGFAFCLFLIVAIPYWHTQKLYGIERHYSEIRRMLPRIQSYIIGDRSLLWFSKWEGFSKIVNRNEHQMFIGAGAFSTIVFALLFKPFLMENPLSQRFFRVVGVLCVGTLVLGGVSLYQVLAYVPGVSAVRAVSRIILVLLFPIGFIVGQFADYISRKNLKIISSMTVLWIMIIAITMESILAQKAVSPIADLKSRIVSLERKIPTWDKDSILVVAAEGTQSYLTELDAMLFAQSKGIKTLNGYSGSNPPGWIPMKTCEDVKSVVDAANQFYIKTLHLPFPLQRDKIIYVGFPENENGCKSIIPHGPKEVS